MIGQRKDGTRFPLLLNIRAVTVRRSTVMHVYIHDITEQKKAIQALQISENKINAILTNAVDGIITIDRNGIMEMINPLPADIWL